MYRNITLCTSIQVGSLPLFSFRYHDNNQNTSLLIVYGEDEHDCIVFHDSELLRSSTYEIRADGVWADINCETVNEHWSFSLESFALRVRVDEYLRYREAKIGLLIGERIPFGYELDATTTNGEDWILSGDIYIEKDELNVENLQAHLSLT